MNKLWLVCLLLPSTGAYALEFSAEEMLGTHNHWRELVGVPPLQYSAELAASSRQWAEQLQQDNHCRMRHSSPDGKYGENLYWASAIKWSDGKRELQQVAARQVVDSWASERSDFDYEHNSCAPSKMCGHYTQVIWRSTTLVGCGAAVCEDTKEQVWVCRYQTPGNWVGERPY
ncbi:MAG: SCP-like extracellular [Sideroxydans sp. RIFOXYB12_FULL_59_6]|nr:MAG: SCP-like extracellular [Sideroxydans sp. RIFOXYB12_FULL_59_6]